MIEVVSIIGSYINDVMFSGRRGYQVFHYNSIKVIVLKSVIMGEGVVKNDQKLQDVIYG